MENKKLKEINKKYYRPENCPNTLAPKVSSDIWNRNLKE